MPLKTIAVIGGGIGGLAAAILLSNKGFQVTVYDKAKSPLPVGAGFLLQPPGQAVLQELGVLQEVAEQAVPIFGLQSKTLSGRAILNLEYNRLKGAARNGLGVQRSVIYDALLRKASISEHINFVWDSYVEKSYVEKSYVEKSYVERSIRKDNKVSIVANETMQDYDLCILSSGSNSRLAEEHFKGRIKRHYGWGCLWTTFELPNNLSPNILHQRCQNSNKMMGILPVLKVADKVEAALYWSMKTADLNRIDEQNFPALKDQIMGFWPDAKPSIEPLGFNDFVSATYNDIWTPKPFNDRLVAIGDISHATSPQLGQGCTMALLDAWTLAMCLQKDGDNLAESLAQWWSSRRYQLAYVRQLSRILTPLFQSENKLCEVFRDWIMAPVGRLPFFDQFQLKTLASEVFLTSKIVNFDK
jgi:2-polyprenyl-6-methoxyphenol hydroxylase-like FAD-dependent oxidoreductase